MTSSVPLVISTPLFLFTVPFLVFFASVGMKVTRDLERGGKVEASHRAILLILVGGVFSAVEISVLAAHIGEAGPQLVGWLMAWFCGHGLPCLMVLRGCIGLYKLVRKVSRAK